MIGNGHAGFGRAASEKDPQGHLADVVPRPSVGWPPPGAGAGFPDPRGRQAAIIGRGPAPALAGASGPRRSCSHGPSLPRSLRMRDLRRQSRGPVGRCARRPCTTLSKPDFDKSGWYRCQPDDPESRTGTRAPGPDTSSYAIWPLAPATAQSSLVVLVLHGTIRPCLAYMQTSHLARLSCSRIRTRTPRPRRSVPSLTSCSRAPSPSLKASMAPRRSARFASTPRRDSRCHRRLCRRRDRVRHATRAGAREAAPRGC